MIGRIIFAGLLGLATLAGCVMDDLISPQADFEKGRSAYLAEDYPTALRWWRKAAEQGLAEAQFNLGHRYREGRSVKQDDREAVRWYRKAAEQGYAKAQSLLGVMYVIGQGVTQDYVQAHKWFNIASALGYKAAKKLRKEAEKKMTAQQIAEAQREATKWLQAYEKRPK